MNTAEVARLTVARDAEPNPAGNPQPDRVARPRKPGAKWIALAIAILVAAAVGFAWW
jgi:hypothetical protein